MLHGSRRSSASSRRVRLPASAWRKMWVSRLSIPAQAGRKDVALDLDLAGEAADQRLRIGADREELGDGPAALGDYHAFRVDAVEDREAVGLELGCRDRAHRRSVPVDS